jgi:hypothetical protein
VVKAVGAEKAAMAIEEPASKKWLSSSSWKAIFYTKEV